MCSADSLDFNFKQFAQLALVQPVPISYEHKLHTSVPYGTGKEQITDRKRQRERETGTKREREKEEPGKREGRDEEERIEQVREKEEIDDRGQTQSVETATSYANTPGCCQCCWRPAACKAFADDLGLI